jgi:beta-galactosidase
MFSLAMAPAHAEREVLTTGWAFHLGDARDPQQVTFEDSHWRRVVVPHDWSIEDKPDGAAPFDPKTAGGADSGYLPGGVGWYRRHIELSAAEARGAVLLQFEAVYMDCDVWVNGTHVLKHHYGYSAFTVDASAQARAGDNVVAIRVNHEDPSSRWYAGSGIIRPVHLFLLDSIHIAAEGPAISTPVVSTSEAEVAVVTPIRNASKEARRVQLLTNVVDGNGKTVKSATSQAIVPAGEVLRMTQRLALKRPALWSTENPHLYSLSQVLRSNQSELDNRRTRFGIRSISFDAKAGFLLNGQSVRLRGGNIHHDHYMLGAAGFPRADERKVELIKAAGYNAIRNAHNPASQATLDAADRLGMLVIDEAFDAWVKPKRPKDYARFFAEDWQSDIESLIATGRNHPSVILWSIGNELPEQGTEEGAARARMIAARVHVLDPTRPVTAAVNVDGSKTAPFLAQLDVSGYNYRPQSYGVDHAEYPDRVMYGAESYPADVFEYWRAVETMPWVVGDFVWTAVDYLGEGSIGWTGYASNWNGLGPFPWHLAYCGEIDATGLRRPGSYYREIVWKTGSHPVAAFVRWPDAKGALPDRDHFPSGHREWVLPDLHQSWTWPGEEGQPLTVVVFSALPEVELRLNGRKLGRKKVGLDTRYQAEFSVPYEAGALEAKGFKDGVAVAQWALETAGRPAAIHLGVDRDNIAANGADIAYVTANLVDASGRSTYLTQDDLPLSFRVTGAGELAGVGNGNPYGTESFTSGLRRTFHGRAVAAVRSATKPGSITVSVTAPNMKPTSIQVKNTARRN